MPAPSPATLLAAKPADEGDTRQRLIEAALGAFAEQGLDAVSIRSITARAGQGNQTAVRYYFGDKEGLVAAVLDQVGQWLAPLQQEALDELAANPAIAHSARGLVALAFAPLVTLFSAHALGVTSIRFLSRLTWQSGGQGQALLVATLQPYFLNFQDHLQRLFPEKPRDALTLQFYLAVNNVIHGLADHSLLRQHRGPELGALYPDGPRMLEYLFDYIAGGLGSPATRAMTAPTRRSGARSQGSKGSTRPHRREPGSP